MNIRTAESDQQPFRLVSHMTLNLQGYGQDSGDLYHLKEHNTVVSHIRGNGKGETFTQVLRTRLYRKGEPTKVTFEHRAHFVEHADGTRSVERSETSIEC